MTPGLTAKSDWVRGRAELAHMFPTLVSSLATLWLALNQSSASERRPLEISDSSKANKMQTSFEAGVDPLGELGSVTPYTFGL